ncbi:MAG: hypothetical protein JNM31_05600 [Flavobacteriales bacterium]|nr:hypothetical protein [Flavobacteriales bacterium]
MTLTLLLQLTHEEQLFAADQPQGMPAAIERTIEQAPPLLLPSIEELNG